MYFSSTRSETEASDYNLRWSAVDQHDQNRRSEVFRWLITMSVMKVDSGLKRRISSLMHMCHAVEREIIMNKAGMWDKIKN